MHKNLFIPKEYYKKIEDINLEKYMNFKAIIIDHDNTLVKRGEKNLDESVERWLEEAKKSFKIGILSNNRKNKLHHLRDKFDIPIIENALKPLPISFRKMMKILDVKKDEVILIGDQIFTDILGGNLLNFYTILVEPKDKSKDFILTKFQRIFETILLKKIKK